MLLEEFFLFTFVWLNQSCLEETMRASVFLLFAFLALVFVAAYAAVEEEADDPSLTLNEDSDEASDDGARVKRAAAVPPRQPGGNKRGQTFNNGCWCFNWFGGSSTNTWAGCRSNGNRGCSVYVWRINHWRWCRAGDRSSRCYCNGNTKRVRCYAP
ncbi:hypothetical protein LSAT2_010760 [Lamellibrachia satsuma]|nr:hypothetical protein LSAT2_010760 [Lamellibrachia satsuma]